MMIKIVKKFFVKLMIFSFVFPIYAENGVVGDAFITKAEFDKGLVEFNERLNIFEASINSKIDSQVTSYLDRNGIWSPTKQTLNSSTLSHTFTATTVTLSSGSAGGNENYSGPYNYINNISKTGLIFGTYEWKNNGSVSTNSKFGWTGSMQTNTNWRSDLGMCFMVNLYEYKGSSSATADRESKYSNILFIAVGETNTPTGSSASHILASTLPSYTVTNQFKFFVTKGNNLKWEGRLIYHFGCCDSATALTGADNTLKVTMKDANVY